MLQAWSLVGEILDLAAKLAAGWVFATSKKGTIGFP